MFNPASTLLILLLSTAFFVSTGATPAPPPPPPNFQIRVWRNYKAGPPFFDFMPEIDGHSGASIVNRTLAYPGFYTAIKPGPIAAHGKLYRSVGKKVYGYLKPLPTNGHYQLDWADEIPTYTNGILSSNFTRAGFDCGGNCGGIGLKYDLGETTLRVDTFFVAQKPGGGNVWFLRWTKDTFLYPIPAGAYSVYIWASQV